jgi:hypothetical protein
VNASGNFCPFCSTLTLIDLMKHFLTKEGEAGPAIHQSFMRFDLIHGAFNRPLAPNQSQTSFHRIIIALNSCHKAFSFSNIALVGFLHPGA